MRPRRARPRSRSAGRRRLGFAAMPQKRRLLTPGPTPVPPEVLAALAEPVIHHRAPDFKAVFARVRRRLRRSSGPRTTCSSSPRPAPARSSRPSSTCSRRASTVLAVSWGKFGERWAKLAAALRLRGRDARLRVGRDAAPGRPRAPARRDGRGDRSSSSTRRPRRASSPTSSRSSPPAATPARSPSSTRSRASARCRSRPTRGASTSSSPARRRR